MERSEVTEVRFASCEDKIEEIGVESLQFGEEIQVLMSVPPESGSSFTALLELPANQAVELLHATPADEVPAEISDEVWSDSGLIDPPKPYHHHPRPFVCTPTFPSNTALLDRASRFSAFASATEYSPETSSIPSNSSANAHKVKPEPVDSDSNPTNSSPVVSDAMVPNQSPKSTKRKEREKKVKATTKKSKMEDNSEKLPYVHVRARRGQATDSHSLAERARREKINARMKLLQDLVPGCSKISGTAMVLDEIISHVQSLQRQVEILSMSLAAVNPSTDVNLESLLAAESGSLTDISFPGVVMPLIWPELEGQVNGSRQQHYQQLWNFDGLHHPGWGREDDNPHFIAPENSLLSYDSSANSASLQTNRLKMEL